MHEIFMFLLYAVYVISCLFLIVVIMLRQGEAGGLSTAFGGTGETFLGARAAKAIDKVIIWAAVIFVVFSVVLNLPSIRSGGG
jgi:preprotein translocase subunit SecG